MKEGYSLREVYFQGTVETVFGAACASYCIYCLLNKDMVFGLEWLSRGAAAFAGMLTLDGFVGLWRRDGWGLDGLFR